MRKFARKYLAHILTTWAGGLTGWHARPDNTPFQAKIFETTSGLGSKIPHRSDTGAVWPGLSQNSSIVEGIGGLCMPVVQVISLVVQKVKMPASTSSPISLYR